VGRSGVEAVSQAHSDFIARWLLLGSPEAVVLPPDEYAALKAGLSASERFTSSVPAATSHLLIMYPEPTDPTGHRIMVQPSEERAVSSLGDRMKDYEGAFQTRLPRRLPVIIRLDGKAFRTFTRRFEKPYDEAFHRAMHAAGEALCEQVEGCRLAYGQSDEISLLLTDWTTFNTQAWFNNEVQKLVSVAASICTAEFNAEVGDGLPNAHFDARCFTLPRHEVVNYFIWRQQDATRNSILSLSQAHFSHKAMHGKNTSVLQDMLMENGVNWNDCPTIQKRGWCAVKETFMVGDAGRTRWVVDREIPIFTAERGYIESRMPELT